jgi:uncharacterized protein RhaS with RHS repeats
MRKSLEWVLTGTLLAGIAAAAVASEAVRYSYDAKGRLIRVEHNGSINNGVITSYTYDHADNRINKVKTP